MWCIPRSWSHTLNSSHENLRAGDFLDFLHSLPEAALKLWPLREKWWTPNLWKATKEVEYICSVCRVRKTLHDYQRGSRMVRWGSRPMLVWWGLDGSSTWRRKGCQCSSIVRRRAHWWWWIWPVDDWGKCSCKCVTWWSECCSWYQLCWTRWTKWRKCCSWGKMRWR